MIELLIIGAVVLGLSLIVGIVVGTYNKLEEIRCPIINVERTVGQG